MPEIKTCEQYVLADLIAKDKRIADLEEKLEAKNLTITALKEQVENAKNLLRNYLQLKIKSSTVSGNPMIDVEPIFSSEFGGKAQEDFEAAQRLLYSLFKKEELRVEP